MTTMTRRGALLALALLAGSGAMAQTATAFPSRPIKLVVPYPPGGSADQVSRALAERLGKSLATPVVVENKPGGNTIIAADAVAHSSPDGHTLFLASNASLVLNGLLQRKMGHDPQRDFAPVGLVSQLPLVVVVNPPVPARNVSEFIAHAKAHPGKLNFASVGVGNPLHLAVELFKAEAGVEMTHVAYQGSAPALTAVIGGEVHTFFDVISSSLPHIQSGRLRALAVTSAERLPVLPQVPTVAESGLPGFEATTWFGIAVAKATPTDVVTRLNAALNSALADATFRSGFEGMGLSVMKPNTPREMQDFVARDREKWAALMKARKITLEP